MKRLILGASLAAICGMASAQINYKTTIKTDKADITKIYLRSSDTESILDSAVCKDGQATFEGKTGKPGFASFSASRKGKPLGTFILDEVPTVISCGTQNKLETGSALNQKLFAATHEITTVPKEKMNKLQEKLKEAQTKYGQNLPDSIQRLLQNEYEEMYKGMTDAIKKTVEDNKDNLVAAAYIGQCLDLFGLDYVKTFLASYPHKDAGILRSTHEYIKALERKVPGTMFTDFTMNDMDGTPKKLSDYVGKGNYVLVDFWASWCGPCRAEMPNVKKAYEQFHAKGFEIVGISFDNNKAAWLKATEQMGITWPQLSDLKGWGCEAGTIYGIRGIPATILFGPDGKVVATDLRSEALQHKLEEIYK